MSISILNRGASSGLKPELTVIAPSGSTIDLLQNGTVVKTYTLGADETEHTFVVKVGTYTARGTLGDKTNSVDVAIDTVGQYEVEIKYGTYLFDHGDITAVSGGWTAIYTADGGQSGLQTNVSDVLYATSTNATSGQKGGRGGLRNVAPIDFSQYKKACFHIVSVVYPNATALSQGYRCSAGIRENAGTDWNGWSIGETFANAFTDEVKEYDISDVNYMGYVFFSGAIANATITIDEIWLE